MRESVGWVFAKVFAERSSKRTAPISKQVSFKLKHYLSISCSNHSPLIENSGHDLQ